MQNKPDLQELRRQIGDIDSNLLSLLAQRMEVSRQIGLLKQNGGLPVVQQGVAEQRLQALLDEGREFGLAEDFIRHYWQVIHEESCRQQS